MSGTNDSTNGNTCVVCYKHVEIYSIGMCEHPVCYECSTRMRVLCQQNECPICRQELPKVVFTREIKPFRHLRKGRHYDSQYAIFFDDADIHVKFGDLLAHACSQCGQQFDDFSGLKDHMRRKHELHYCDLCVANIKIFSSERRCYTRAGLAQHRRKGDVDDKSHKGHPLCEFCDQRYMDNDELYRHLRRDHLYCHFCDADGLHQYYNSYDYLRDHFRDEHYLCEEGSCIEEKFTCVFRSDIDMRAHKASVHGKQLGKAAAKQARTLEFEFTLAPRSDNHRGNRRMPGPPSARNPRNYNNRDEEEGAVGGNIFMPSDQVDFVQQPSVDVQSIQEFPTLGNSAVNATSAQTSKGMGNLVIRSTVRSSRKLEVTDENFPALGPEASGTNSGGTMSKTVLNVSSASGKTAASVAQSQTSNAMQPNVSIHVNRKMNGTVTARVSAPNVRLGPAKLSKVDFPALGSGQSLSAAAAAAAAAAPSPSYQWTKVTCVKPQATNVPKSKKVAPAPILTPPAVQSSHDFPSLEPSKAKRHPAAPVPSSSTSNSKPWPDAQQTLSSSSSEANKGNTSKGKTKKKKAKVKQESGETESKVTANHVTSKGNASSAGKTNDVKANSTSSKSSIEDSCNDNSVLQVSIDLKSTSKLKKDKKKGNKKNSSSESSSVYITPVVNSSPESSQNSNRKRTELKIDSLNTSNNNKSSSKSTVPKPPGFSDPPPGFSSAVPSPPPPPPGFVSKMKNLNLQNDNNLTFTNSSGESYTILPNVSSQDKDYTYIPPPDFSSRNKSLVERVNQLLNEQESIDEFRFISGLFQQGTCDAEDYYKRCRMVMGSDAFKKLFPELLALLPDINKQTELLTIHQKETKSQTTSLEQCLTCGQILSSTVDLAAHTNSHTLESHFPTLGKNVYNDSLIRK